MCLDNSGVKMLAIIVVYQCGFDNGARLFLIGRVGHLDHRGDEGIEGRKAQATTSHLEISLDLGDGRPAPKADMSR